VPISNNCLHSGLYLPIPIDNLIELASNLVRNYGVEITTSIAAYIVAMRRFNTIFQETENRYDNSPNLSNTFRDIQEGVRPDIPSENAEEFLRPLTDFINGLNHVYISHQTNLYNSFINLFEVSLNIRLQHLISNLDAYNIGLLYDTMRPFMFNLHEVFLRIYNILPYLEHITTSVHIEFRTTAISTTVMILYYIGRSI